MTVIRWLIDPVRTATLAAAVCLVLPPASTAHGSSAARAYYEDFYLDAACAASGPEALDGHNGHAHGGHDHADEDLGYHYHLTVDAALRPTFPYTFGPTYRGRVEGSSFTSCGAAAFGFADRRAGRR
ncbi:hypothetical protein [Thalassobaculum fulvum]|uniref:hypothetical protein n=1 Tax=Thalassobaculum fulvum TaxID=1633335 RepID=UPI00167C3594|nr:hypothetical protein [Thalassobaculum fulvum]